MKFENEWEQFCYFCHNQEVSSETIESNGVRIFIEAEADHYRDAWIYLLHVLGYETPDRFG